LASPRCSCEKPFHQLARCHSELSFQERNMIAVTVKLKAHLQAKSWLKDGASDEEVRTIVGAKLASGELKLDEVTELTKSVNPPGAISLDAKMTKIAK